jgi:hypothetical protein
MKIHAFFLQNGRKQGLQLLRMHIECIYLSHQYRKCLTFACIFWLHLRDPLFLVNRRPSAAVGPGLHGRPVFFCAESRSLAPRKKQKKCGCRSPSEVGIWSHLLGEVADSLHLVKILAPNTKIYQSIVEDSVQHLRKDSP